MASLGGLAAELIRTHFSFYPEAASEKGYPGFDDRLGSYTEDSVRAYRARLGRILEELPDPRDLSDPEDRIDRAVIESHARADPFVLERLKWHRRSPYFYVSHAFGALEMLLEGAQLDEKARLAALASRLAQIPRLLMQARRSVRVPVDVHLEAALEMLSEGLGGVRGFTAQCRARAPGLKQAIDEAERAMGRYAERLAKMREGAAPWEPMGEEAFAWFLRHQHRIETSPAALAAEARAILDDTARRLAALESVQATPPGGAAGGRGGGVGGEGAVAASGATEPEAVTRRSILDYFLGEIDRVRRFLVERRIVTLPSMGEIEIRETPPYLLPIIPGLFYQAPALFGSSRRGYLFVRPIARRIGRADARAWRQRMRLGRFRNAVVHEVWPGHHLQVLRSIENRRILRRFDENDFTMEGWALYCEGMMAEQGLWGAQPPLVPLRALRFRAARAIVDIGIHTGEMTLEGAVDFLVDLLGEEARGFLTAEVRRYALEPGQALSYLAGRNLVLALREEIQESLGPAFDLGRFHDAILEQGTIPLPLIAERVRAVLGGGGRRRGRDKGQKKEKRTPHGERASP